MRNGNPDRQSAVSLPGVGEKRLHQAFGIHRRQKEYVTFFRGPGRNNMKNRMRERGFTLIEAVIVIGIIGAIVVFMFPSIMNSLETRDIENSARDIQTTLQQARYRAVNDKIHFRVRFAQDRGLWRVFLESADAAGTWTGVPGFLDKTISPRFRVTLDLPASHAVEFSPVGVVEGFDSTHNSLTLQSQRLKDKRQPDLRILTVFGGGTIRYVKAAS
jgi:Tfp pilus assembly protein FimT